MKTAKDLLDELSGDSSHDDNEDWLSQRLRTAHNRVWETEIPMMDTRGVPPDEGAWEDSWGKRIARAFTGLEDVTGLGFKALGELSKGRTAQSDEMFNNFIRDIYKEAGKEPPPPIDTNRYLGDAGSGQILSNLGDYLFNRAHSPEREKAFNPNNKWEGADLRDVIKQGKFGEYLTDTDAGFLYDLPYNFGNIAGFLLPTRAGSATQATRFAGEVLNPLSGLLGKAGATRAADIIGSKAAREALGSGVHFGTTMGPYGAMVNAGTIIDELKKQGKSDAEIADAMGNLVREELPADIAFAALTGNVVKGNLGKAIAPRGSSLGRKIAANAAGIPLEMAGGNLSNVNQMILSEKYSGLPYGELFGEHTPAENKAGFMGATAGVPFAIYGGGRGVADARAADKAYERFQKYIAEGAPLREAALQDMPQMARDAYRDAQNEYSSNNLRAWAQSQGVSDEVYNLAAKVAQEEGVPVERVIATIVKESNGNQNAVSGAGAIGVMQLMPETARGLGVDPYDLEQNIRGGTRYLKQQYDRFGDWDLAHAAYNAGEGALYDENGNFRGIPPYEETQNYVAQINDYLDEVGIGKATGGDGRIGKPGYRGEGGKGEGTYWVRNDGVSFDGAQPQLLDAMDMLGKFVYDATGVKLVASAGTNGDHPSNGTPHGHDAGYKVDIVDAGANGVPLDANGVLFNSDFTPTEFCHKLIEYGRQLGLGMNLEGVGTQNVHLDVALDGTQWDGNGDHAGGFNPQNGDMRSDVQRRADELFDQRFRERVSPQRQEEPPMEARQVDLNDSGLHDAFARDRMTAAIDNNDEDAAGFWGKMFDGDTFKNTEENRAAVRQRYGTELEQFAQTYEPATVQAEQPQTVQTPTPRAQGQGQTQQQQAQPQQQKPTAKNTSNKYIRGDNNVLQAGNKFLEELRAKGNQADAETVVRLQTALRNNDLDTVKNILEANNRPIVAEQQTTQAQPQQQTQTDPVKQNRTPENVLNQQQAQQQQTQQQQAQQQTAPVKQNQPPENIIQQETPQQESTQQQQPTKPKKQPKTGEEKAQAVLNKPLQGKKSNKARRKAGNAVIFLAGKNGIEISDTDRKSLENGKTSVVNQWRDILIGKGILSPQTTQSSPKQSSPAQSQTQQQTQPQAQETTQPAEKPLTLQERAQQIVSAATEAAGQNWEDIKRGYQERGRVAKSDQSIIEQQADDDFEDSLYRDDAEEEWQTKAEQQERERQAKQDKELQELQARQAEEKRLRDEARARQEQNEAERQRQIQNDDIRAALGLPESDGQTADIVDTAMSEPAESLPERQKQGQQLLQLLESPQFKYSGTTVKNVDALKRVLPQGQAKAIRVAQDMLRELEAPNRPEPAQREVIRTPRTPKTQEEIATEQRARNQKKAQRQADIARQQEQEDFEESLAFEDEMQESEITRQEQRAGEEERAGREAEEREQAQARQEAPTVTQESAQVTPTGTQETTAEPTQGTQNETDEPDETDTTTATEASHKAGEDSTQNTRAEQTEKGVAGTTTEVISDNRTPYQVKYRVVEADGIVPSHVINNGNVFTNDSYPTELQPRDRMRVDMGAQVISMSNSLSPKDLMESRNVNQGAPVVRSDGVVLNGNGRSMAIIHAYENGNGETYKNAVVSNAEKFGLDANKIAKMRHPVLVRELVSPLTGDTVKDITQSSSGGARLSPSEQAKIDGAKLTSTTLGLFPEEEVVDLSRAQARDFLKAAINDIATPEERNALTDKDGNISQDGINRVRRALFALAYGDEGLIGRMSESTEDNVRGVTNALLTAAPAIAKVQSLMEHGALHKYSLRDISSAVKKLSALRDEGKTVATFLREQGLFGEETATPETKEILSFFDRKKRAPNKIASFLKEIARGIRAQGNPKQIGLFGEIKPSPLIKLIKRAQDVVENGGSQDLFSDAEKRQDAINSLEGNADTRIENFVADKDLTPFQKLLQSFSKKLGVPIQFFRNPDGKFHGSFSNGVLFLNVNSKKGLGGVFWHESFHWLKANNPKLYAKLVDAAGITDKDRQAFLDRTGRKDLKTNEEIDEEILADQMDDVAKRTGLLQSIAGKNRGVIERVVQWLKDTMNKFIETFRNPTGRLTTKQAQALAKEFGQIARQLKDENGEQIFRVNNRTGDIEVVEGRKARGLSNEEIETAAKSSTVKYSVDPNDNGSESLGQKIKNFASTVFNGKPQSKNHKQFIVDKLEELTRYKTYFNTNAKNEADVIVDSFQKIIRARHAYDFEKLLPATGEPIAKVLGLNPSAEMSNYIADWMMTGAINNTSKEATAFQKAMRAHPAEAELLQSIRDTFQEMANMTAEEAVESNIVRDKKSKTFREWLGEKFSKEQWVDDLHPIKQAYDQMLAKAPPAVADIIKKNFDPYMSASLFRGKGAIADMMIGDKKEVTAEDIDIVRRVLQHEFPNVDFSSFKPLAVTAKMVDYDVEGLERYALAKLDKEMHEKKNSGDAKYANLTPSYTEAQCDEIINAGKAKYDAAHRALVDYSNFLTAIQYSTGVISASQFYQRVNGWKNFVPTARVFEEYEDISVDKSDSSKHKTGSKRRVYAPLGKLEDNTNLFIRQALQNRARLEIVTMARLGNFGDIFAETPKGYPQGHTIHFKENGKMKYLVTPDESLARAVEAIQTPADANIVVQAFKTAGMVMRGLYTMVNAEFVAGNPFRDLADAFIHNKYGSRNPFVAIPAMVNAAVSGFAQSVGAQIKSEEFRTFLAEGGAQSGFSYEITEGASRRVNSFGKKSLAKSTWDKFLMIAEASENMTRFSTFKTAKDNLAKQHGGVATPHDLKLAAMQARRATVDFARAGRTMRGVNKVLLFSNAAMQSLALWGEKINAARKSKEGRQELFAAVFKTVMSGVMPALALAALNFSDDDRRKRFEQRPTWEKDTYWIFGDGLRVPKGMDLGIKLTSALTEEFAMWLASNKPVEWKRIANNIGRGLPSITTTIFTPAVESWFNYSIFKDAPIVPYGQKDDPKYKQYGKNTSWVAKQLGNMFNQSPRQIDHLIAGYGGSMLTALTGGSDGIPIVRRFMFDPDENPRIVQDYYKALKEQEEMLVEYKARRADGEKVELPEDYDRGLHARLKNSSKAMSNISKAEMRIMDDPKLDADKRKEKLRELEKRRVALCERVLGKAR